jgi:phage terminase large subunit
MSSPLEPYALELEAEYRRRVAAGAFGPKPDSAYQRNPIGWMVARMGIPEATIRWSLNPSYDTHRWDGTSDPLATICQSLADGKDTGAESATGTGKTFLGALLVLWFLACFEDSIVVTTAPIEKQLTLHIWKEIGGLFPKFKKHYPQAELLTLKLRMKPGSDEQEKWAAVGFACGVDAGADSATRAQGFHAQHMLIITEETPGIDPAVMTAFENTCTADHNIRLALGNPDHQADALHKFVTSEGVTNVRISAYDHPNVVTGEEVVPGAVGRKSVLKRKKQLGAESRLYQSRVRGISPSEAVDALIKLSWCTHAKGLHSIFRSDRHALRAFGVDVANSENGDLGAIARGSGRILDDVSAFPCPNANALGRRVVSEAKSTDVAPEHVGVDGVGVGAGTVNEARDSGFWVQTCNGGDKPDETADAEKFNNKRSQMYWQMRLDLERADLALPNDDELIEDLTTPKWLTKNGKICVESKEEIKKRIGRSPNKGDAAVYWNWVRNRDVPLMQKQKPQEMDLEQLAWLEQQGDLEPWNSSTDDGSAYHQILND